MPKTAMNPTSAGTLSGKPEISRKNVLPTSAIGMLKMIVSVFRRRSETSVDQHKDQKRAIGMAIASLRFACCAFSNWPPQVMKYPGGILTCWFTAAWAS